MKLFSHSCLLLYLIFVVFLLSSSSLHILAARSLTSKQQGELVEVEFKGDVIIDEISNHLHPQETNDSFDRLLGLEKCENGDKSNECLTKRVLEEAHLDYIYTQNYSNP